MKKLYPGSITDVRPLTVGQVQDEEARTGVTVVLCGRDGATVGVDVRGASPGTRETDLCIPENTVQKADAVTLTGGSAFGLRAASGVMDELESMGIGVDVGVARVPIVPAAAIMDLVCGRADVRPTIEMGREAVRSASAEVQQGAYGAGCGATVGKLVPGSTPAQGGVGTASLTLPDGSTVAAIVAVNACGDVFDPHTGTVLACGRNAQGDPVSGEKYLLENRGDVPVLVAENTCIGVIATDAALTKAECRRLAVCGHDGLARTVYPAHTVYDGDTLFALATGTHAGHADLCRLCTAAAEAVSRAVCNAVCREEKS